MNLNRLLAASRSIMGLKPQAAPYKMNQDHLLPKFAPVLRSAASSTAAVAETPLSESVQHVCGVPVGGDANGDRRSFAQNGTNASGWLNRLFGGWRRWTPRGRGGDVDATPVRQKRPFQSELALNGLKVVRNDLTDSDFQFIPASSSGSQAGRSGGTATEKRPLGMVWNRLSARLLRQATQEFNLVQKERGRFLSQAGARGRGPRDT